MPNDTPLTSKFSGYCKNCEETYPAGTAITKENGKWVHFNCDDPTATSSHQETPQPQYDASPPF